MRTTALALLFPWSVECWLSQKWRGSARAVASVNSCPLIRVTEKEVKKAFWVESAAPWPVVPLSKDRACVGSLCPFRYQSPQAKGPARSLTSLAPAGLEAPGAVVSDGTRVLVLPLTGGTHVGRPPLSELQVPQSGQLDFPTGRACHPSAQHRGVSAECVRAELGSLPSTRCSPGLQGGVTGVGLEREPGGRGE